MRDDERRQAAAQRCADLMNAKFGGCATARDYEGANAFTDAVLQLDELARAVLGKDGATTQGMLALARQHILPQPKPSPVERLAKYYDFSPKVVEGHLKTLGLKLVEVDPSDDQ